MAVEAEALRQKSKPPSTEVFVAIPWMEFSYRVGDRISKIDGRDIQLPRYPDLKDQLPVVEFVTFDFDAQRTAMQLRVGLPTY